MDTNITALKTALQAYVDQITNTLLKAKAQVKLDQYADAESAFSNINASAAASYSDARGTVNKRLAAAARDQADALYADLQQLCGLGGVDMPGFDPSVAYWDLSGFGSAFL